MIKKAIQSLCIWLLKKTKYQFKIQHGDFTVEVQNVGIKGKITRSDFVCKNKGVGFLGYTAREIYFDRDKWVETPNKTIVGLEVQDFGSINEQCKQYNKLVKEVQKTAKVIL
jgi:hypothetical protein